MYKGYLMLGGKEIANSARVNAYVRNNAPAITLKDCDDCPDIELALDNEPYTSPMVDDAPWFDPVNPETARFYGLYPLDVRGVEDSTRSAIVTENVTDGGSVGQTRFGSRAMRVRALMVAADELAMNSGMTWLRNALNPSKCVSHGGSCGGATLCYFAACPVICDTYNPLGYQGGFTYPIPRETVESTPTVFQFAGETDAMWKAEFFFPITEGLIVKWGAVNRFETTKFEEIHGPVISRRTNYVEVPWHFRDDGLNAYDYWNSVSGSMAFRGVPNTADQWMETQGGNPAGAFTYDWAEYETDYFVSEARLQSDGTLAFVNLNPNPTLENFTVDTIAENLYGNPRFRYADPGSAIIRTNQCINPTPANVVGYGAVGGAAFIYEAGEIVVTPTATPTNSGVSLPFNGGGIPVIAAPATWFVSLDLRSLNGDEYTFMADGVPFGTPFSLAAGETRRVSAMVTFASVTMTPKVLSIGRAASGAGTAGAFAISKTLIEQTDQERLYFSGATPDASGWDYAWSGSTNNSPSVAKAIAVEVRRNIFGNATFGTPWRTVSPAGSTSALTQPTDSGYARSSFYNRNTISVAGPAAASQKVGVGLGTAADGSAGVGSTSPYVVGAAARSNQPVTNITSVQVVLNWYTSANSFLSSTLGPSTPYLGPGVWHEMLGAITSPLSAAKVTMDIVFNYDATSVAVPAGATFDGTLAFLESGSIVRPPFWGASPSVGNTIFGFVTDPTGPSIEFGVKSKRAGTSAGAASYGVLEGEAVGQEVVRTATAASRALVLGASYVQSAWYTLVFTAHGSIPGISGNLSMRPSSGSTAGQATVGVLTMTETEAEYRFTFQAPAGAPTGSAGVVFATGTLASWPVDERFWIDRVMLVRVPDAAHPYTGPYFDGTEFPPPLDWQQVSWTGVVDDSTSKLTIVSKDYVTAPDAVAGLPAIGTDTQVTGYDFSDTQIIVHPTNTDPTHNNTYATFGPETGFQLLMEPEKTYTLIAESLRYGGDMVGTPHEWARRVIVLVERAGVWEVLAESIPAEPSDGTTLHRLDFTIPVDATGAVVRLYNGYAKVDTVGEEFHNDFSWTKFGLITNGPSGTMPYNGILFSGDSADDEPTIVETMGSMPTPNGAVTASFDLRYEGEAVPTVTVEMVDYATDAVVAEADFIITQQWQRYSFSSFFAPGIYLRFKTTGTVNLRKFMVESGMMSLPYFDGDSTEEEGMAGYLARGGPDPQYEIIWMGEPKNSISRSTWIGRYMIATPLNDPPGDPNTQAGICNAYPWLQILQGEVINGEMLVAYRERVSNAVQTRPYERTFHDVTCVEGPLIINEWKMESGAWLREVEFLLVAGAPFAYGTPEPALINQRMSTVPTVPWVDPPCSVEEPDPIVDPDCPPIPAPPRPPLIPTSCVTPETAWRRYWLEIPAEQVSAWSVTSPKVVINSGNQALRQVRVRAYPNPFNRDVDDTYRLNILPNSGLRVDTTAWSHAVTGGAVASLTRVAGGAPEVIPAFGRAQITTASTSSVPLDILIGGVGTNAEISPSRDYTMVTYVRGNVAGTNQPIIQYYNSADVLIATDTGATVPAAAGVWEMVALATTAPAGAARVRVVIRRARTGNWAVGNQLDVAGPKFEYGVGTGGWFDGSFTDADGWYYGWRGATNTSQSVANRSAVDPCSYCSEFIISYLPAHTTLTVDSILEKAFANVAGEGDAPANHLLYSGDGGPMIWPELACGMSYFITIDTPVFLLNDVTVSIDLTKRE